MVDSPRSRGRLLPKGWPSRVRSAVVHAISMSNVVFAVTRSHAENHFNARVPLVRGRSGVTVELRVDHRAGRKHLPLVSLKPAA